jgi:hypothetical protein
MYKTALYQTTSVNISHHILISIQFNQIVCVQCWLIIFLKKRLNLFTSLGSLCSSSSHYITYLIPLKKLNCSESLVVHWMQASSMSELSMKGDRRYPSCPLPPKPTKATVATWMFAVTLACTHIENIQM